jgi:hypothetical protein
MERERRQKSSNTFQKTKYPVGRVAEWLMAADCKSARASVHRFESCPFHHLLKNTALGRFFIVSAPLCLITPIPKLQNVHLYLHEGIDTLRDTSLGDASLANKGRVKK